MCKGYIGPIRMVEGGEGKSMKEGGDTEWALRGNGRWGKMEREREQGQMWKLRKDEGEE